MQRPTTCYGAAVLKLPHTVGDEVEAGLVARCECHLQPITTDVDAMGHINRLQFQGDPVALINPNHGWLEGESARLQGKMALDRLGLLEWKRGEEYDTS